MSPNKCEYCGCELTEDNCTEDDFICDSCLEDEQCNENDDEIEDE